MKAAAKTLAQSGDREVNVEAIVNAADVARGTFYNYFESCEALFNALWIEVGSNPFHQIERARHEVEDSVERLAIFIRLILHRSLEDHIWGWLIVHLANSEQIMDHELAVFPSLDTRAGIDEGRYKVADLHCANDVVVGATLGAIKALLTGKRKCGYPEDVCVMILRSLGVGNAEAEEISQRPLPDLSQA